MSVMSYIINNIGLRMTAAGFIGRDFGECALSNVGVFGMKKGFVPLSASLGIGLAIAMGKKFKKACV